MKMQKNGKSYSLLTSFVFHVFVLLMISSNKPCLTADCSRSSLPSDVLTFRIGHKDANSGFDDPQDKNSLSHLVIPSKESPRLTDKTKDVLKENGMRFKKKSAFSSLSISGETGTSSFNQSPTSREHSYIMSVRERIQSNIFYPLQAQQLKMEGRVTVSFLVDPTGSIHNLSLQSSSPYAVLNEAAFQIVMKSSPLPVPPENFIHHIQVPLTFKITP